MLLAVDVGNSNIVMGVSEDSAWKGVWRLETRLGGDAGRFATRAEQLFRNEGIDPAELQRVIISSVVPQVTPVVRRVMGTMTESKPLMLTWKTDTGIELGTEAPEEMGTDLIANAVAAWDLFSESCIVVDFGTATTLMYVESPGIMKGGAICPGLKVSARALAGNAAQLPDIPLESPARVISGNTLEAMQSGVVLGHISMVEGMIAKMKKESGAGKIKTVATGGMVSLLAPLTDRFDAAEPMLTLNGLRLVAG